jgi:hypothetical protein
MAAYVDYAYYAQQPILGTAIASADFGRLSVRASKHIDALTFGRAAAIITADTDTDKIDALKMATCAIADELQKDETTGGRDNVTSEKVGNVSVSYGASGQMTKTLGQKIADAATLWLWETDLMYRGLNADERQSNDL